MARSKRSKAFGSLVGKSFGAVLRHHREEKNWSIEELSAQAGMDRAYLGQVEQGRRVPTLYIVFRLIRALRVDAGKLMGKVGMLVIGDLSGEQPSTAPITERIPLGEDTCPRCNATFILHAGKLPVPEPSKYKCAFCRRVISMGSAKTILRYEILRPPENWGLSK
jgi:XRE family transcriptional regulator, regulator of sulfur utilization